MKMKDENFLHDLASPLAGVELLIETLFADIPLDDATNMRERLQEALRGIDRIRHLLEEKRSGELDENN